MVMVVVVEVAHKTLFFDPAKGFAMTVLHPKDVADKDGGPKMLMLVIMTRLSPKALQLEKKNRHKNKKTRSKKKQPTKKRKPSKKTPPHQRRSCRGRPASASNPQRKGGRKQESSPVAAQTTPPTLQQTLKQQIPGKTRWETDRAGPLTEHRDGCRRLRCLQRPHDPPFSRQTQGPSSAGTPPPSPSPRCSPPAPALPFLMSDPVSF